MKVLRMIGDEEIEILGAKNSGFGGMGGFFDNGMRWKDYLDAWEEKGQEYAEACREYIIENEIKYTGMENQDSGKDCFLFDDNTFASFSFRAWGDLLAAIWSEAENTDHNYMHFYC